RPEARKKARFKLESCFLRCKACSFGDSCCVLSGLLRHRLAAALEKHSLKLAVGGHMQRAAELLQVTLVDMSALARSFEGVREELKAMEVKLEISRHDCIRAEARCQEAEKNARAAVPGAPLKLREAAEEATSAKAEVRSLRAELAESRSKLKVTEGEAAAVNARAEKWRAEAAAARKERKRSDWKLAVMTKLYKEAQQDQVHHRDMDADHSDHDNDAPPDGKVTTAAVAALEPPARRACGVPARQAAATEPPPPSRNGKRRWLPGPSGHDGRDDDGRNADGKSASADGKKESVELRSKWLARMTRDDDFSDCDGGHKSRTRSSKRKSAPAALSKPSKSSRSSGSNDGRGGGSDGGGSDGGGDDGSNGVR
ncbi:unnamed protein product, partial [Phaeothamnion confervicola]